MQTPQNLQSILNFSRTFKKIVKATAGIDFGRYDNINNNDITIVHVALRLFERARFSGMYWYGGKN